ncbi:MAG: response regulator [Pedobacter sp.]|nr:MAG: response regulator [Pedobacter sp.]
MNKYMPQGKSFIKAVKGKIIIALLLACLALVLAWNVSKVAFNELLSTVNNVTAPSERLSLVNVISRKINNLDQRQKKLAFKSSANYSDLIKDSRQLRVLLDSLAFLYTTDSIQTARISKIKKLLIERDMQFLGYLKVRSKFINNDSFSAQVKELNELASKRSKVDSTVLATEEKTSTTTFYPDEEKPRSFLGKIFGGKKRDKDGSFTIISEEKIKRDTIALSAEELMAKNLEVSLKRIETQQKQNSATFLNREEKLINANALLVNQMLDVLREVENEVVSQIKLNGVEAETVVNNTINTTSIIMVVFFGLTILLLYLILSDITRSNKYRYELERAKDEAVYHSMAKQRFLANMSHEIRTPLQSIIGYTEILGAQDYPDKKAVAAITNSSEHLLQIVNEVLDYNRIISGKLTFLSQPFDIKKLLDEVISVLRPQAQARHLELVGLFDLNEIKMVEGDPFRLKQILYNLLGNAIKFTEKGEVKLIAGYKKKGEILHFTFQVKDTGIGMSEEQSQRIFNEFEQLNPVQNADNQSGAGLGLTIIKSLIENQNGRIYVKSKEKSGSTFTFYLSFKELLGTNEQRIASSIIAGRSFHSGKVWIVDDDQLILDLCEIILKANGVDFRCFSSPSEMLAAEIDSKLTHVLMDMRMPDMDGVELCRLMRERVNPGTQIIAVTAQVMPAEREHLLANGFDGLILKPFRAHELLQGIFGNTTSSEEELEISEENNHVEQIDLSYLKKMTFGDASQMAKIINRFIEDSTQDEILVNDAISSDDFEMVCLIVHRLAGRVGQMGIKELAKDFRVLEIDMRNTGSLSDSYKKRIELLLTQLNTTIIRLLKEDTAV